MPIMKLLAVLLCKNTFHDIVTMPKKWGWMDHQRFYALHLGQSRGYATTLIHNWTMSCLSGQQCLQSGRNHVRTWWSIGFQGNFNGASTIFAHAFWNIYWQWNADNPQWIYRQPLLAKMLVTILRLPPTSEHQQSVHRLRGVSERYTAIYWIVLFQKRDFHGQSL